MFLEFFMDQQQFVTVAKTLWHPYDELRHIPDLMIKAIFELLSNSKLSTARSRLKTLQLWRSWATELTENRSWHQVHNAPSGP